MHIPLDFYFYDVPSASRPEEAGAWNSSRPWQQIAPDNRSLGLAVSNTGKNGLALESTKAPLLVADR